MAISGDVAIVGCGRLGSAIIEGWLAIGAVDPARLIIISPSEKPIAAVARGRGARINPVDLTGVGAVVLAVKPAKWREASAPLLNSLPAHAVVVSVMAGVRTAAIGECFAPRPIARVMPTTGVATGQGVAAIWSADAAARQMAHGLFSGLAEIVDLDDEGQMDVATAVAGSGPAYVHAFTRALASAGVEAGLDESAALRLARGAVRSAASAGADDRLEDLIARIASPGGTTEAGLNALKAGDALNQAVGAAVAAALSRARDLSRDEPAGDEV